MSRPIRDLVTSCLAKNISTAIAALLITEGLHLAASIDLNFLGTWFLFSAIPIVSALFVVERE